MLLLPANIFLHTHIETTKLHITEHRIKREGIKSPQILKCHIAFSSLGQIRCYKNMQPPWRVLKPQDCWHSCQDDTCPILRSEFTLFTKDLVDKRHHHEWTRLLLIKKISREQNLFKKKKITINWVVALCIEFQMAPYTSQAFLNLWIYYR